MYQHETSFAAAPAGQPSLRADVLIQLIQYACIHLTQVYTTWWQAAATQQATLQENLSVAYAFDTI